MPEDFNYNPPEPELEPESNFAKIGKVLAYSWAMICFIVLVYACFSVLH